jgi:DNA repair protein RadC
MGECVHRHLKESMSRNPGESDLFSSLEPSQTAASSHNHESEVRLLEAVVGSGIAGMSALAIANELISKYGSIMGLFGRDMGEFLAIKGLNSVKIIRIAAALEIAARVERALS